MNSERPSHIMYRGEERPHSYIINKSCKSRPENIFFILVTQNIFPIQAEELGVN